MFFFLLPLSPSFPQGITIHLMKFSGAIFDNDFQDCNGTKWKNTFPDLDFALLGYDILHGDPNAECDPGFKHPIFRADYSELRQSADCRYSIPVGLTAYPCQSCLVSFESKLVRNKQEMSKLLGGAAKVEGKREHKFELRDYSLNSLHKTQLFFIMINYQTISASALKLDRLRCL